MRPQAMVGLLRPPASVVTGWSGAGWRWLERAMRAGVTLIAGLAVLAALTGAAQAQDVLPVPPLAGRVVDQTATLTPTEHAALTAKLEAFERETGTQIVVLLVASTQPEDDFSYANRVANAWKIGRRDVGDGLLVLVAKNDRRVRIEVAKTLEGAIPDLAARQIIERAITPAFRAGNFSGGLDAATDALMARVRGESLPAPTPATRPDARPGLQLEEMGLFFFVAVPVLAMVLTGIFGRFFGSLLTSGAAGTLAWWWTASALTAGAAGLITLVVVGILGIGATRRGGSVPTRRHGGPPIIFGGGGGGWGGGSGGGGFSGGGGGFSSGGGGDFGGGGASGSW